MSSHCRELRIKSANGSSETKVWCNPRLRPDPIFCRHPVVAQSSTAPGLMRSTELDFEQKVSCSMDHRLHATSDCRCRRDDRPKLGWLASVK
jgi:hypothetical protein